jgi:hypothetical protein
MGNIFAAGNNVGGVSRPGYPACGNEPGKNTISILHIAPADGKKFNHEGTENTKDFTKAFVQSFVFFVPSWLIFFFKMPRSVRCFASRYGSAKTLRSTKRKGRIFFLERKKQRTFVSGAGHAFCRAPSPKGRLRRRLPLAA